MNNKKIAFVTSGYLPVPSVNGGAVETLVDLLIDSKEVNEKYSIDVYSIFDEKAYMNCKKMNNVNYFYIKNDSLYGKFQRYYRYVINHFTPNYIGNDFLKLLIKKYKEKLTKYDIVIVENKPEFGIVLRKYVTGKLIFHSHNDFLNKDTKNAKKIFDSYDKIYGLSKYICNRISEIDSANKDKVELLYNGIDVEKFNIQINIRKEREKFNLKNDDIVFLYTGRIVREKGVLELVEAFKSVHNNQIKLLIAGKWKKDDLYCKEIKKIIEKNANIMPIDYIDYKNLPVLYRIANYGVVPSVWEEPFALTVIEHLASGHPVIATKSGAIPELVNEECSIIVDKGKNLIDNLGNAITRAQNIEWNSKICVDNAKTYGKKQYIDRFIELMEKI